jgi:hypothetical protein
MKYRDLAERLMANTVPVDHGYKVNGEVSECWVWIGNRDIKGYGRITLRVDGKHKKVRAHRVSFELFKAATLEGDMTLNHKCTVRPCIHPDHVELMTRVDNSKERCARQKAIMQAAFAKYGMMI